jgi:hypothetical protein
VTASEIPDDGLKIPGGPTIASPLTTRRRAGEGLPFLEAFAAEQYTPEALSQAGQTYTFTVTLDTDQAVLWGSNWCTTTDAILRDNFAHITLEFSVNAVPIDLEQFVVADIPAQDAACRYYLAVVSGWPEGETLLDIRITFDEPLSDGFSDYPAGTHVYHYVVTRN